MPPDAKSLAQGCTASMEKWDLNPGLWTQLGTIGGPSVVGDHGLASPALPPRSLRWALPRFLPVWAPAEMMTRIFSRPMKRSQLLMHPESMTCFPLLPGWGLWSHLVRMMHFNPCIWLWGDPPEMRQAPESWETEAWTCGTYPALSDVPTISSEGSRTRTRRADWEGLEIRAGQWGWAPDFRMVEADGCSRRTS